MIRKNIIKASFASLLILSMAACKKDSDAPNGNSKSKAYLISKGGWKLTNQEIKTDAGSYEPDPEFADLEACEKDNVTLFKADKSYEQNEGATKCDPSDPQIMETGTWDFTANETKVRAISGGDSYEATIEKLDENTLQLVATTEIFGEEVGYRFTFSH